MKDLSPAAVMAQVVDDHPELTRRDHSNLTHPQGYRMAACSVDKSSSFVSV